MHGVAAGQALLPEPHQLDAIDRLRRRRVEGARVAAEAVLVGRTRAAHLDHAREQAHLGRHLVHRYPAVGERRAVVAVAERRVEGQRDLPVRHARRVNDRALLRVAAIKVGGRHHDLAAHRPEPHAVATNKDV